MSGGAARPAPELTAEWLPADLIVEVLPGNFDGNGFAEDVTGFA